MKYNWIIGVDLAKGNDFTVLVTYFKNGKIKKIQRIENDKKYSIN